MTKSQIQITKGGTESTGSFLRRFTKSVQQSGIVKKAKKTQFYSRPLSEHLKKSRALKRITRKKERERLRKLGKM